MTNAIVASGLRKSYGEIPAVRGIDISIDAGETVALLGPNGAGKSTTIDMILGLAEPDAGTVSVLGGSPSAAIDAGWIGAMLQTGALIRDLSVGELVAMVASLYPEPLDVGETLEMTGLSEIAAQRTQKLSGGQTQRVRFAVALVSNPKLLVLDEPTVAMDVEGRRSFWTTMRSEAARGRTILFATHYLEEADAYADRAVLMAHGQVVADGPPTEIKAMVGKRTIRATLPGADLDALGRWGHGTAGRGTVMSALAYTHYELLRTVRNRRFFILSLGFPLVLYFLIAGPNRNVHNLDGTGISAPMYFMVGMVAFGTMSSMLSCGARIAAE